MSDPDLAEALRRVIGDLVRLVRDEAGTPSSAQSETLGLLGRDGAQSMARLAAARGVRHQSMRLVVAQMEAEGLVRRAPDPADARSQLVMITETGHSRLQEGRAARSQWIAARLAQLSPQDRAALTAAVPALQALAEPPART